MPDIGDFKTPDAALEFARSAFSERSERARQQDKAKRAPITTNAQRYASNPDHLDFPGIDTPREAPNLLPKDLKQSQKPVLTAEAKGEKPVFPASGAEVDAELFSAEAVARDVSLSSEEALKGIGATSPQAIGGFDPIEGRETDPLTAEPVFRDEPPELEDERTIGELDAMFRL